LKHKPLILRGRRAGIQGASRIVRAKRNRTRDGRAEPFD
jgi:hypothetical protein